MGKTFDEIEEVVYVDLIPSMYDLQDGLAELSRAQSSANEALEKKHDDYSFIVPALPLISLAEVAEDVDRAHPVAEVVLKGRGYKEFHYLLIHDAIVLKAKFLIDVLESIRDRDVVTKGFLDVNLEESTVRIHNILIMKQLLSEMSPVTSTVYSYVLSESEFSFQVIFDALHWVRTFTLRDVGEAPRTIIVRYR